MNTLDIPNAAIFRLDDDTFVINHLSENFEIGESFKISIEQDDDTYYEMDSSTVVLAVRKFEAVNTDAPTTMYSKDLAWFTIYKEDESEQAVVAEMTRHELETIVKELIMDYINEGQEKRVLH